MTAPTIRTVRVRLMGEDDDAREVAEILAQLLAEASDGRCQAGTISAPYPNRRGSGSRVYLDLYLLIDSSQGSSGGSGAAGGSPRSRWPVARGRRELGR